MSRAGTLALTLCLLMVGCGDPPTRPTEHLRIEGSADTFTVWRGFQHRWSHNHRWNRFGNRIEEVAACPDGLRCFGAAHSAASGTSSDVALFETRYTVLEVPGVGFTTGTSTMTVSDLKGGYDLWTHVGVVEIRLGDLDPLVAERLRARANYRGLLQGWDVYSRNGWPAAKPIDFALEVGDPEFDPDSDSIHVQWRTFLRMACSSGECPSDEEDPGFSYSVQAWVGVLGFDDELVVSEPVAVAHEYAWDAPKGRWGGKGNNPEAVELTLEPLSGESTSSTAAGQATPALRRVQLHLFHWREDIEQVDQHMLEWRSHVDPQPSDAGVASFTAELMFKNWAADMRQYQQFAYEDVGAAAMSAEVILIEAPGALRVEDGTWLGAAAWTGRGAAADGDDAVVRSWELEP